MINALFIILATACLLVLRGFLTAKTLSVKLLTLNSLNAIVATFIAVFAFFTGQEFYLDISILYALIGFISNAAFMLRAKKEE